MAARQADDLAPVAELPDGENDDAGEDAEDDDDDQELDEREAAVAPTNGMQTLTHV